MGGLIAFFKECFMLEKINMFMAGIEGKLIDSLILISRLILGQAFLTGGWGKLQNLDNITQFFTSLGIPFPELNAIFIANIEFVGGIFLILGILNRLFSYHQQCSLPF